MSSILIYFFAVVFDITVDLYFGFTAVSLSILYNKMYYAHNFALSSRYNIIFSISFFFLLFQTTTSVYPSSRHAFLQL